MELYTEYKWWDRSSLPIPGIMTTFGDCTVHGLCVSSGLNIYRGPLSLFFLGRVSAGLGSGLNFNERAFVYNCTMYIYLPTLVRTVFFSNCLQKRQQGNNRVK